MPKIFISYRRKSWGFTHRLADDLRERLDAEVFIDMDSIDQTDFERSIVTHLRGSDAVLLVISETTFADRIHKDDDWVRREIREALEHKIPLVLVCVEGLLPPSGLPDDIKDVARIQGVNFYPEYFTPGVERLADFVTRVAPVQRKSAPTSVNLASAERSISGKTSLDEALDLLDQEHYDKAIFLLEALRQKGFQSKFVDIDQLLTKSRQHQTEAKRHRRAQLDYDEIAALAKRRITWSEAADAFQKWCTEYPDLVEMLDIESNLRNQFLTFVSPDPVAEATTRTLAIIGPPFFWIPISVGAVTIEEGGDKSKGGKTFPIAAFELAKYPVTNMQFAVFVEDGGYENQLWWTSQGWEIKTSQKWAQARYRDIQWPSKSECPVLVSGYEAAAFCLWLTSKTGDSIHLPNERQWQRAAQGDNANIYPWGDEWDNTRCNNSVNSLSIGTTPVKQYEGKGDSPFGVVDMSGNVWEWCSPLLNRGNGDEDLWVPWIFRGGSWKNGNPEAFRSAYRDGDLPVEDYGYRGFRIARAL